MTFKVGDLITGNPENNNYLITSCDAIMRVVEVMSTLIGVMIIKHKVCDTRLGDIFYVAPQKFILCPQKVEMEI
jgi:hypothetical protein